MKSFRKLLILSTMAILFASSPDWQDDPGAYQYTATIVGGIVLNTNGEQMGGDGDMFAAFDEDGNVRGLGLILIPTFGPYQGTPVFEVQLRSDNAGDILHFKYYYASSDVIIDVSETYEFVINDIIGDVINPMIYNFVPATFSFSNVSSTSVDINYESNAEISGFQFDVSGVALTSAYGGDAEENGFSISFSSTVLGFSLSGATIPAGSGTLLSLVFVESSETQILEISNVIVSGPSGASISNSGPGSIEITNITDNIPDLFEYNISTLQAFYYFKLVLINDIEVESNDWVGAFNGDVCVGARKWDTSQCGNEICEVPVMGDQGESYTEGYMITGDVPSFKIYDASENLYYTAEPSENAGWLNNGMPIAELLSANVSIPGCTDPDFCNYDSFATEDDGSCDSTDESCFGCTDVDACNYNLYASIDNGSCWYEGIYDCDGICIAGIDCAGVCGGSGVDSDLDGICDNVDDCIGTYDACGICNGLGSIYECGCSDIPDGDCDCLGNVLDACGVCGGSGVDEDSDNICDNVDDCIGGYDTCGICNGPGSIYECGCSDIPDGDCDCLGNVLDACGVCGGSGVDSDSDGICDNVDSCIGAYDACGICNGSGATAGCGCSDIPDGDCDCSGNVLDACGVCGGSGVDSDSDGICDNVDGCIGTYDACGICNGPGSIYECGCSDIPDGDCDCLGNVLDACGVCGGSGVDSDSDGICDNVDGCIGTYDACGICNGPGSIYECGCSDIPEGHCDCLGNEYDICGICNGGGPGENYNCDGDCVAEIDCQGICGGISIPTFQCQNVCVVCNPADCINLDSNCNIMSISPYLLPDEFGISNIFPNPFNPVTHIQYELTQFGLISIIIYDIQGRVVDQLMNEYQSPGHYGINWNADNNASGMYIVEMVMQLENNEISRDLHKILYLK